MKQGIVLKPAKGKQQEDTSTSTEMYLTSDLALE